VILDWVPAHFPSDAHGMQRFDGTALYEHADPRAGLPPGLEHADLQLGRAEVRCFLIASALDWLERFHVDGLRVDAVASMLYRDYSRPAGRVVAQHPWAAARTWKRWRSCAELNDAVAARFPGVW
jgi:1,4-alpha-glucan branching enzyme